VTFAVRIPLLEGHGGIEMGLGSAHGDSGTVAARHLVGEHQEEEVLVRHLLLTGEGDEALGKRVEEATELEATQHRRECSGVIVSRGVIGRHLSREWW
jgi:hypothetical protein